MAETVVQGCGPSCIARLAGDFGVLYTGFNYCLVMRSEPEFQFEDAAIQHPDTLRMMSVAVHAVRHG
ncbi:hypothetical protein ADZ36_26430 [Streptomyces fradiae]|uniref:Uncharacterized protein n=1 Tax=Streptomyces fradiae TaxID=1906 RepID=A0ACC4W4W7_STRFR|nr:hypothetical protein ADZ36_26430 [Streptomyces fradiae]OFA37736.1 hypothetical protein BEN35_28705 [Streptomyces fradiae]